ncbi:unnamed protein product [Arabidopsis halleri]
MSFLIMTKYILFVVIELRFGLIPLRVRRQLVSRVQL